MPPAGVGPTMNSRSRTTTTVGILFLVQMVPFTLNGIGVREAFFVGFLGRFDVAPEAAFAAGFLYYAVTIAVSLPGGFILLWRSVRPAAPAS